MARPHPLTCACYALPWVSGLTRQLGPILDANHPDRARTNSVKEAVGTYDHFAKGEIGKLWYPTPELRGPFQSAQHLCGSFMEPAGG